MKLIHLLINFIDYRILLLQKFIFGKLFLLFKAPLQIRLEYFIIFLLIVMSKPFCLLFVHFQKLTNPLIPSLIKLPYQTHFYCFLTNRMVNRMISNEFQVPESPIVCYSRYKIVNSCVLIAKFTRIIRTYTQRITQTKQQRS